MRRPTLAEPARRLALCKNALRRTEALQELPALSPD